MKNKKEEEEEEESPMWLRLGHEDEPPRMP
jgi:hypothetical protein